MKIYDITRTVSESIAVWPDDRPFLAHWTARMAEGSSVNIGAFEMSTHAGTHVDAPLHFQDAGRPVDELRLEAFFGPAYVVDVRDASTIEPQHVENVDFAGVPRILFKTDASAVPDHVFNRNFVSIEPGTIGLLARRGVVLIGTDAPSVDPYESTALPTHHELARAGIVNLENLVLRDVEPGLYHLMALPLKLAGLDAAPVRAILASSPDQRGASH